MAIWHAPFTLAAVNEQHCVGLAHTLGIVLSDFGEDWLRGTMPVAPRIHQPMGLLHGGASVVLAESLGSIAANLCIDTGRLRALGQDINANHLRGMREGTLTGTARPVHIGRSSQVWQIDMVDDHDRLVCVSRLTLAVIAAR